jgi:hypothetical protein
MHTRILRFASRHAPKAGAVCGSSARTDLCGGWQVTAIPIVTNTRSAFCSLCHQGALTHWAVLTTDDEPKLHDAAGSTAGRSRVIDTPVEKGSLPA